MHGTCPRCSPAFAGTPTPAGAAVPGAGSWIRATGRTKTAGVFLGLGGIVLAISSFLPWASAFGLISSTPSGGAVVVLIILGVGTVTLAVRVLQGRRLRFERPVLWVLSVLEALLVVVFFDAFHVASTETAGAVTPAAGFYFAVLAVAATLVGTIVLQVAKTRNVRQAVPGQG